MNHFEHTMIRLLFGAALAMGSTSCDGADDEAASIVECFQHTGEPDDPCPSGCGQVSDSEQRVVWTSNGECDFVRDASGAPAAPRFCAPGYQADLSQGQTAAYRRLDPSSPGGTWPILPEEVRVMDWSGVAGWEACAIDMSPLCTCAWPLSDVGMDKPQGD
jgi:hypothetical protein